MPIDANDYRFLGEQLLITDPGNPLAVIDIQAHAYEVGRMRGLTDSTDATAAQILLADRRLKGLLLLVKWGGLGQPLGGFHRAFVGEVVTWIKTGGVGEPPAEPQWISD